MDSRFLWFGLVVLAIIGLISILLWAAGDRSSWADWQDEHHESGSKGKGHGDSPGDGD